MTKGVKFQRSTPRAFWCFGYWDLAPLSSSSSSQFQIHQIPKNPNLLSILTRQNLQIIDLLESVKKVNFLHAEKIQILQNP
jgi:hypothetical protein